MIVYQGLLQVMKYRNHPQGNHYLWSELAEFMRPADFFDIQYLSKGSERQCNAFNAMTKVDVLGILTAYRPFLAGTIPLGIDIPSSDLDIICEIADESAFRDFLRAEFSMFPKFRLFRLKSPVAVVAQFEAEGFAFEIFGQRLPIEKQNAYRHLMAEYHILQAMGEGFREEIIRLKLDGFKTEAAFASTLGLKGDPFQEMLRFEHGFPLSEKPRD